MGSICNCVGDRGRPRIRTMESAKVRWGHYHGHGFRGQWRGRKIGKIRSLNLSVHPLLAQTMDNSGKVFTEHLAELPLDLTLNEGLNNGY